MKRALARALLGILLLPEGAFATAQVRAPARARNDAWYEVALTNLNRSRRDYGKWLEQRRRSLLRASVQNPFFWYSFWTTACAALLVFALLSRIAESRQSEREHARIEADIRNHDLYSREKAREAIDRYNRHIELCNLAAESAESGEGRPGWGNSAAESARAELGRVTSQLEAMTQERNKLQEEVRQKSLIVAELSTRLDALSKRAGGARSSDVVAAQSASAGATGDGARFVGQINRLEEQLYAERQRNRKLKGG